MASDKIIDRIVKNMKALVKTMKRIVIRGTGECFEECREHLDRSIQVDAVCTVETDGSHVYMINGKSVPQITPNELTKDDFVFVAVKNPHTYREICSDLSNRHVQYAHIYEAIKDWEKSKESIALQKYHDFWDGKKDPDETDRKLLKKFIDFYVDYEACNLRCEYCYVGQHRDYETVPHIYPSPEILRCALSRKRIGGTALINFCAGGETLFCPGIIDAMKCLAEEGHFVSIVTNGTATDKIKELASFPPDIRPHIFVKMSFHYLELKKRNLLSTFVKNVDFLKNALVSYTIEMVAYDGLLPYREEIKRFSSEHFGALPQLSIPRDETKEGYDLLSNYSLDEFSRQWESFNSQMFALKKVNVGSPQKLNCMAGEWSLFIDYVTGDIYKCQGNPKIGNLYQNLDIEIPWKRVGSKCCLPYCYNCHAYQALGLVPDIKTYSYYDVRDREMKDGTHFVHGSVADFFKQKLYDNYEK